MITSLFLILPVISYQRWEQKQRNAQFFIEVENSYIRAQLAAIQVDWQSSISIDKTEIKTIYSTLTGDVQHDTITLPDSIQGINKLSITFTAIKGDVSQATTFSFIDQLNNIKVAYTVQMGSGKLVKKIETL